MEIHVVYVLQFKACFFKLLFIGVSVCSICELNTVVYIKFSSDILESHCERVIRFLLSSS